MRGRQRASSAGAELDETVMIGSEMAAEALARALAHSLTRQWRDRMKTRSVEEESKTSLRPPETFQNC